jgi:membrane protease YdiL (CAAX protease family)
MVEILNDVTSILLSFAPFLLLYFFANLSEKFRILAGSTCSLEPSASNWFQKNAQNRAKGIRFLLITIVLTLYGIAILGALLSILLSPAITVDREQIDPQKITAQGLVILFWLSVGSLVFIPWIRKQIAKRIPTNPDHVVHTLSLSLSTLLILQYHVVLVMGIEEFGNSFPAGHNHAAELIYLWTQEILFLILALIGVGWLTRRKLKECLSRLGIVKPDGKTVLLGIGFGAILFVMGFFLEELSSYTGFLVDPEVNELTKKIYGPLVSSIPGMISIGLAAGLGEEALFRGALQPRFGIGLTSILFTIIHANYGFSIITVIVFLLALTLGFLRNRYSTTLTMIAHASYNIITSVVSNLMS